MDERHIKAKVESGYYINAEEMVHDAVRRLREQDLDHQLLAALEIGERDIAASRTVPYTPALLKQVEQEARLMSRRSRRKVKTQISRE